METRTATSTNAFINAANFKPMGLTENGAATYLTTGSAIVDQFGKAGNYRCRPIHDVFGDQERIWNENPQSALKFIFYLRLITRKTRVNDEIVTDKPQNGQGSRDEVFKRLLWVAKEHPSSFYYNIWVLPLVGSWKDLWTLMYYDIYEGVNAIDRKMIYEVIAQGLMCKAHIDLVKKYMPRIKSESKLKTDWLKTTNKLAKEFANFMRITYSEYNKTKASGKAHEFQKLICSRKYDMLKWNHIPGRALTLLASGKFLENHNLVDNYVAWVKTQPTVKFTGYPFELSHKLYSYLTQRWVRGKEFLKQIPLPTRLTIDAQFKQLVDTAKQNGKITENVLVALDTSGSMGCKVDGLDNVQCIDIATSLALFFAELNEGAFHNKVMMFDNTSFAYEIQEEGFCERIANLPGVPAGGTNFQSVVEALVDIRNEHPEIPLKEYPKTILCISDMEFNPVWNTWQRRPEETNYEYSKKTLLKAFPQEFVDSIRFIWWDCTARYSTDFEARSTDKNVMFLSGFDGSIMSMLLNEEAIQKQEQDNRRPTPEEIVRTALSQEILDYVALKE